MREKETSPLEYVQDIPQKLRLLITYIFDFLKTLAASIREVVSDTRGGCTPELNSSSTAAWVVVTSMSMGFCLKLPRTVAVPLW